MTLSEALNVLPNKTAIVSSVGAKSTADLDLRIRRAFSPEMYDHWLRLPMTGFGSHKRRFTREEILSVAANCDSMGKLLSHQDVYQEAELAGLISACGVAVREGRARRKRIKEASERRQQNHTNGFDTSEINRRIDRVFGRGERWAG